jgi:3-hydroxy acid dehydrogenase/malonic semialdehyde reductase
MPGTVVITGASSGFGAATARKFYEGGFRIVVAARRSERLADLVADMDADRVHTITLDVSDRAAVDAAVQGLPDGFRDIDVLVNNAGLALGLAGADETDLDEWETMVDTNVKGLMYTTRLFLPLMVERGRGHVVNLGSVAASWPYPGGNVYGGTKAFVQQFSRNLRADLLGKNIRVTNVEPGMSDTEFSLVRFDGDKTKAEKVYEGTEPLSGEDIAEIIYFVATLPPHININQLEVMPTCQAWAPFAVHRE